jgi:NitT/TauT family transport system substrate-binding protein
MKKSTLFAGASRAVMRTLVLGALLTAPLVIETSAPASAEASQVRFARQLGLGYLQVYLMEDLHLVEKHAKAAGLEVTTVYTALGNPAAVNEAIISGSVDFGAAGITPFVIAWDKTRGNMNIKAVAALNCQPAYLNTIKPEIKSIKDFTDADRIALPSVKLSFQATILQMAAEKELGDPEKLDPLTVSLSHPDGVQAMLSGKSEITAHFTTPPFQYQELKDPKVHRVISTYDVTGGATTFSGLWALAKFRDDNPKLFKAVFDAMNEANDIIKNDSKKAAEIFIRLDKSKLTIGEVDQMLHDPEIIYTPEPRHLMDLVNFMVRTKTVKNKPNSWKDLFFPEVYELAGS